MSKNYSIILTSLFFLAIMALMAACAPLPMARPQPTPTPTLAVITPTAEKMADAPLDSAQHDIAGKAIDLLTNTLNVSPDEIKIHSIQQVSWPDASLGCPQPGEMYAQVITPGYLVAAEVDGKPQQIHLNADGEGRVCDPAQARPTPQADAKPLAGQPIGIGQGGFPAKYQQWADAAADIVAKELNVKTEDVMVQSVQHVTWPSAALGCPQPGQMYAEILTPGYLVQTQVQGQTHSVHMDEEGNGLVCPPEQEQQPLPAN